MRNRKSGAAIGRGPQRESERVAQAELGLGPVERRALAGEFLQPQAVDIDGLVQAFRAALALAEPFKCVA